LRCCKGHIILINAPDQIYQIIKKYHGGGRKAALLVAAELIQAGFNRNARW
jgi:hypothetical protein